MQDVSKLPGTMYRVLGSWSCPGSYPGFGIRIAEAFVMNAPLGCWVARP